YVSFNGGAQWQPLQQNLPAVAVQDLVIQPRASALVVASHGLGFWILDDLQPLREMSQRVVNAGQFLFTPQTAYLVRRSGRPSNANDEGQNPPNGAVVYYELKQDIPESQPVTLTFSTASGEQIATFSNQPPKAEPAADGGDEAGASRKPKNLVA